MPQTDNESPPAPIGGATPGSTTPGKTGPAEAPPGEPLELSWHNAQGNILGLALFNFALRVATLGIYHFWGKTEVRKRIWAASRLQGEPLEYTGTGWELFLGFVIVFFWSFCRSPSCPSASRFL